jgi:hypothetical protein
MAPELSVALLDGASTPEPEAAAAVGVELLIVVEGEDVPDPIPGIIAEVVAKDVPETEGVPGCTPVTDGPMTEFSTLVLESGKVETGLPDAVLGGGAPAVPDGPNWQKLSSTS